MRNLLSANLYRLRRSRAFWIAVAVMAGVGLFEVAAGYLSAGSQGVPVSLDSRYLIFALVSGVVLSAFCAVFVGTEHSEGTLRRKIAAGHSRSAVYLASLLTCAGAGVLVCLGYILPVLAAGIPLLGFFQMDLAAVARFTVGVFVMNAALCAAFTLVAMLNRSKAASAIICISLAYFLLFLGIYLHSRLAEPEMIPAREYVENGRILLQEARPNPGYVQEPWRSVGAVLYALPGCQAVQLAARAKDAPWQLPLVSLLSAALLTAAGLAAFRRKDLR